VIAFVYTGDFSPIWLGEGVRAGRRDPGHAALGSTASGPTSWWACRSGSPCSRAACTPPSPASSSAC
jgi:hypothetical protein